MKKNDKRGREAV